MDVVNPIISGLSNAKLAKATATAADVSAGKTFYAGNGVLKTGTATISKKASGSFVMSEGANTINCGFRPTAVYGSAYEQYTGSWYFGKNAYIDVSYNSYMPDIESSGVSFTSSGFTIYPGNNLGRNRTYSYIAYA